MTWEPKKYTLVLLEDEREILRMEFEGSVISNGSTSLDEESVKAKVRHKYPLGVVSLVRWAVEVAEDYPDDVIEGASP
ncbi:hypothetical protein [Thermococcus sp.]|uniref:hypothetical protein n=1 Tax=Thermococcus sp. TaxID=35749 RepID=UPI0025F15125|nr:hypothetical protein [Thermococcus sp.]